MLKRLIACLLILCSMPLCVPAESAEQAIVINEVMASNGMYEKEESHDWIELHNRSKKAVDLSGSPTARKTWRSSSSPRGRNSRPAAT